MYTGTISTPRRDERRRETRDRDTHTHTERERERERDRDRKEKERERPFFKISGLNNNNKVTLQAQ